MGADPRLANLPALRKLAKEEARDCHNRFALLTWGISRGWDELEDDAKSTLICVHVNRCCDLTRPASRDAVARLVAEALGMVCGATAPDIARYVCGEHCCDGQNGRMVPCARPIWSMMGADETQMVTFADCPDPDEWDGEERRHVSGISAVTDPAEALTLIALHVLGRPDAPR